MVWAAKKLAQLAVGAYYASAMLVLLPLIDVGLSAMFWLLTAVWPRVTLCTAYRYVSDPGKPTAYLNRWAVDVFGRSMPVSELNCYPETELKGLRQLEFWFINEVDFVWSSLAVILVMTVALLFVSVAIEAWSLDLAGQERRRLASPKS